MGPGPVAGSASRHGGAVVPDHPVRVVVVAAKGPHFSVGLDLKAMGGMLTGGGGGPTGRRRISAPSMAVRARGRGLNVCGCRTPSRPWPVPKPVSRRPRATASGAASTSSRPATSGWPRRRRLLGARGQDGDRGRPGQPAAAPGHPQCGPPRRAGLTAKDISAERPKRFGLVNDVAADADGVARRPGALAAEIAANSPMAVQGPRRCWRPTRAGRWPRASSTWPPGTRASWRPTTCRGRHRVHGKRRRSSPGADSAAAVSPQRRRRHQRFPGARVADVLGPDLVEDPRRHVVHDVLGRAEQFGMSSDRPPRLFFEAWASTRLLVHPTHVGHAPLVLTGISGQRQGASGARSSAHEAGRLAEEYRPALEIGAFLVHRHRSMVSRRLAGLPDGVSRRNLPSAAQ